MTNINFDKATERRGSGSVKWDEAPASDILPLWVADMDFPAAPAIREAIERRAAHGVFGYAHVGEDYYDAIISWFSRRHKWTIRREDIVYTTGVVPAVSAVLQALAMPGELVVMLSPAYNCFFTSIRNSGCMPSESPLKREGDTFAVDWEDLESRLADEKATVFLLCNPHNPTGRVWTVAEIRRMAALCDKHHVRIVSDDIHCEIVMPGKRYTPLPTIGDHFANTAVVLTSPSKAFNIAGLQTANIICRDPEARRRIDRAVNINENCDLGVFGPVALKAAYNDSGEWLDALCLYVKGNYDALRDYINEKMPRLKVCAMEGTYLAWVDITALRITADDLCQRLLDEARVWLNSGTMYSQLYGQGYIRINLATQRATLMEALKRMEKVISKL